MLSGELVMRCVILLASSLALVHCQCEWVFYFFFCHRSVTKPSCSSVRFNLGDLLGRPNRNRENENEGNNGGRVDAGSILGGLLGAVKLFKPINKDASVE